MRSALRIAALFAAYTAVGYGGEYGMALLGQEQSVDFEERYFTVDVRPDVEVDVQVDVDRDFVVDVQVRHSEACSFEREMTLSIPASVREALAIDAGSGELRVQGRDGLDEVRAVARMCASHEELFEGLDVTVGEVGSEIILSAHYPESRNWRGNRTAKIDLEIEVPFGMALDIDDSSGHIQVFGAGDVLIDDSSGDIELVGAIGTVRIDDSSGSIDVRDVDGDLQIEDGSGGIDVAGITGSVLLDDGSGGIQVSDVGLDVIVEDDGSGSIEVERVSGDLRVLDDGSGSIRHAEVEGQVTIPEHKKRKKRKRHRG